LKPIQKKAQTGESNLEEEESEADQVAIDGYPQSKQKPPRQASKIVKKTHQAAETNPGKEDESELD
jgi:hypothetical protein